MEELLAYKNVFTQSIQTDWLLDNITGLAVLRLDRLHHTVSGNKWFKLKYYLEDAIKKGYATIATFGGAFSNHIIATAFTARAKGLRSIGIIRGEEPPVLSHTLQEAKSYGMHLEFVNRSLYKNTGLIKRTFQDAYWIEEGGYGHLGMLGAREILNLSNTTGYTHIVCAVGTGTMMAGIIDAAEPGQRVIGISVMKENYGLHDKVSGLLIGEHENKHWDIEHAFHFGGYAKHPQPLIDFMNEAWQRYQLPTDIVYTAKTLFATEKLIRNHTILPGSNVLMIHSGGLQGNLSLPEKTLSF